MNCDQTLIDTIRGHFLFKFFESLSLTDEDVCLAWHTSMTGCSTFMEGCPNLLDEYKMYLFFEFLYVMYLNGLFNTATPVIDPVSPNDKVVGYVKKDTVKGVTREYHYPTTQQTGTSKCVKCKETPIDWLLNKIKCLEEICNTACMPMGGATNYGNRHEECNSNCAKDNLFVEHWRHRHG